MKKPYSCTEIVPLRKCKVCGKRLKANLLAKNPNAEYCYVHWVQSKGLQSRRENFIK